MSSSHTIFVRNDVPISESAMRIGKLLAVTMQRERAGERYEAEILGFDISLYVAADFEDDQGIEFSKFNVAVNIEAGRKWSWDKDVSRWEADVASIICRLVSHHLNWDSIAVNNMQVVVYDSTKREPDV